MSQKLTILSFAVFLFACSSLLTLAQPPAKTATSPSSTPVKGVEAFVSLEAGFSIDLPKSISSYGDAKAVPGVSKGGSSYSWRVPEGSFFIRYEDLIPDMANQKIISAAANGFADRIVNQGATVQYNDSGTFSGISGREIKAVLADGSNVLVRYLLVNDRVFTLQATWKGEKDRTKEKVILDSFKLVNRAEIIAQKLKAAMPADLPQSQNFKPQLSDSKKVGLRGAVKSIKETKEYLDGTGSTHEVISTENTEFDPSGNLVKIISFDYHGNPRSVTVYGVIDGKRVSKTGNSIFYEYDPPPMKALPGSAPKGAEKPRDSRFTSLYQDKYDEQGRLSEYSVYDSASELITRSVYTYEGRKVYRSMFDKDGKETFKVLEVNDENGNLIEKTRFSNSTYYPDNGVLSYTYLSFDAKGNWTKREVKGVTPKYNGGTNPVHNIEYRSITYF